MRERPDKPGQVRFTVAVRPDPRALALTLDIDVAVAMWLKDATMRSFTTYIGIANSAFLPWTLAAATTLLALIVFLRGAWLVHYLLKDHVTGPQR